MRFHHGDNPINSNDLSRSAVCFYLMFCDSLPSFARTYELILQKFEPNKFELSEELWDHYWSHDVLSKADPSHLAILRERLQFYRSEEYTSELQSRGHLVCRLLLEKKKPPQPTASAARRRRTA